jgi:hypothetical protein
MSKLCLANGGKHHWKSLPTVNFTQNRRECQGCGALQGKQDGKWVDIGSTRWVPLMPSERERS